MCFEFEALYWAKVAEEELRKKEALRQQSQRVRAADKSGSGRSRDDALEPLEQDPLAV